MASFLRNLSPNRLSDKIQNSIPLLKNMNSDTKAKVKKVAIEVLKYSALIIVGGCVGALFMMPWGIIGVATGVTVGSLGSGLVFFAIQSALSILKKYGYPSYQFRKVPPLPLEQWLTDKNHLIFKKVITETLDKEPYFQDWKLAKRFKSEGQTNHYLWRQIQKGVCFGESQGLLLAGIKFPNLKGEERLEKIDPNDLYLRQILEILRSELIKMEKIEHLDQLNTTLHSIPSTNCTVVEFLPLDYQSLTNFKAKLSEINLSSPQHFLTLRVESDKKSHTLFAELSPSFSFYDSNGVRYNGFHEFTTQEQLVECLYAHLKGYHSKVRPLAIKFNKIILRSYMV